jgi:hypothetical protein
MTPSASLIAPPKMLPFEWVWAGWLLFLVISFSFLEGYAIYTQRSTLSRFVWELSVAWPPFPWVAGIFVGFLGAHFFWTGQGL